MADKQAFRSEQTEEHERGLVHDHENEHDHEQAYDSESGHEHTPHHEHNHREQFAVACGEAFLEAHMHDQAATVSAALCPDEGSVISFEQLVSALSSIASNAEAAGGIIGHIKAFAREEDVFAHASSTDASRKPDVEGDTAASFGPEADIQLVAIALLIDQDELISICKRAIVDALSA